LKIQIRSNCPKKIKPKTMKQIAINAKKLEEAISSKIYKTLYLISLIAYITNLENWRYY
jgi:hypothetical protein